MKSCSCPNLQLNSILTIVIWNWFQSEQVESFTPSTDYKAAFEHVYSSQMNRECAVQLFIKYEIGMDFSW